MHINRKNERKKSADIIGAALISILGCCLCRTALGNVLPYSCEDFSAGAKVIPTLIKSYLERSEDSYVEICKPDQSIHVPSDKPYTFQDKYFGGTSVKFAANTCSYIFNKLNLLNSPQKSMYLDRGKALGQEYMLPSSGNCPLPVSTRYIAVSELTEDEFLNVIKFWNHASSVLANFDEAFESVSRDQRSAESYNHFRRQLVDGTASRLRVQRVSMKLNLYVWRCYEMQVTDPKELGAIYLLKISSLFGQLLSVSQIVRVVI